MKTPGKKEKQNNKKILKIKETIQPALYTDNSISLKEENEEIMNAKILKITLHINKFHPELSKYISEMPVTIPDENNSEINLKNLTLYYKSLNELMKKYELEHGGENCE